jgi:RiboL-PSP-HEPN
VGYEDHFKLVDDLLPHLDATTNEAIDPFITSRYAGFLALSSATVLELCVKDILINHSNEINASFGIFVSKSYERLNGRIKIQALKEEHLSKFGERYVKYFSRLLKKLNHLHFVSKRRSICQSYSNVITWRHSFAHEGQVPTNATYREVRDAYIDSKIVIRCLDRTMSRKR